MMKGYAARATRPKSSRLSRWRRPSKERSSTPPRALHPEAFVLAGKVDGIVRIGDEFFLLEHKTASQIDADYLERLWTDFQIILYAWYIEQTQGLRIAGILYNILVKARLQQGRGETEAEFEERRRILIAKSKTGKSSAKRKLPESDETFQDRLCAKYADLGMFHRETLYISRDQFSVVAGGSLGTDPGFPGRAETRRLLPQHPAFVSTTTGLAPTSRYVVPTAVPTSLRTCTNKSPPHEELRDGESIEESPAF